MIKKHFKKMTRCLIGFLFILLLPSCQNDPYSVSEEKEDANFLKAKAYLREGRKDLALETFLKVTKSHDFCPESHFELGIMFLNDFSDPIFSIYHLKKYLQQQPDSPESELIPDLIRKAELQFAKTLPGRPIRAEIDRVDLLDLLDKAQETNHTLQRRILELEKKLSKYEKPKIDIVTIPKNRNTSLDNDSGPTPNSRQTAPQIYSYREYQVQPGDTLSKISQKFYGNRNQWEAIYQANRDILSSPSSLKPGQKLQIP